MTRNFYKILSISPMLMVEELIDDVSKDKKTIIDLFSLLSSSDFSRDLEAKHWMQIVEKVFAQECKDKLAMMDLSYILTSAISSGKLNPEQTMEIIEKGINNDLSGMFLTDPLHTAIKSDKLDATQTLKLFSKVVKKLPLKDLEYSFRTAIDSKKLKASDESGQSGVLLLKLFRITNTSKESHFRYLFEVYTGLNLLGAAALTHFVINALTIDLSKLLTDNSMVREKLTPIHWESLIANSIKANFSREDILDILCKASETKTLGFKSWSKILLNSFDADNSKYGLAAKFDLSMTMLDFMVMFQVIEAKDWITLADNLNSKETKSEKKRIHFLPLVIYAANDSKQLKADDWINFLKLFLKDMRDKNLPTLIKVVSNSKTLEAKHWLDILDEVIQKHECKQVLCLLLNEAIFCEKLEAEHWKKLTDKAIGIKKKNDTSVIANELLKFAIQSRKLNAEKCIEIIDGVKVKSGDKSALSALLCAAIRTQILNADQCMRLVNVGFEVGLEHMDLSQVLGAALCSEKLSEDPWDAICEKHIATLSDLNSFLLLSTVKEFYSVRGRKWQSKVLDSFDFNSKEEYKISIARNFEPEPLAMETSQRVDDLGERVLASGSLKGLDLREHDLRRYDLAKADLRGCDLAKADLRGRDLRGCDLRRANLRGTDLRGAILSGANLSEVNLTEAILTGAILTGADLTEAILKDAILPKVLRRAILNRVNLRDVDLQNADLRYADLTQVDLCRANLQGADLSWAILTNANLTRIKLENAYLVGAHLINTNLQNVRGLRANLTGAVMLIKESVPTTLTETATTSISPPIPETSGDSENTSIRTLYIHSTASLRPLAKQTDRTSITRSNKFYGYKGQMIFDTTKKLNLEISTNKEESLILTDPLVNSIKKTTGTVEDDIKKFFTASNNLKEFFHASTRPDACRTIVKRLLFRLGQKISWDKSINRNTNQLLGCLWSEYHAITSITDTSNQYIGGFFQHMASQELKKIYGDQLEIEPIVLGFEVDLLLVQSNHYIVIEIDGTSHTIPSNITKDRSRDEVLHRGGYKVFRYTIDSFQSNPNNLEEFVKRVNVNVTSYLAQKAQDPCVNSHQEFPPLVSETVGSHIQTARAMVKTE